MLRPLLLVAMLLVSDSAFAEFGIYVPERPKVSLERALPIAHQDGSVKSSGLG
jgi:hypothetical protein